MNKKFKFIVLAAVVLLGVGIFLNQAEAINTCESGFKILPGEVDFLIDCPENPPKLITNHREQGVFVPTKSSNEWYNFWIHSPQEFEGTLVTDKQIAKDPSYLITYDAGHGDCDPSSTTVIHGLESVTPSCSRGGYNLRNAALNFNGSGDYVDLGDSSILNDALNGDTNWTIAYWVDASSNGRILDRGNLGADPTGSLELNVTNIARNNTSGGTSSLSSNIIGTGWNFIVLTRDSSLLHSWYLNGVFSNSTQTTESYGGSGIWKIGRRAATTSSALQGSLSDLRIYNRVLNSSEIESLYNGGHITNGLVAYWPLIEGSGSTVNDIISGNDGTISGAIWSLADSFIRTSGAGGTLTGSTGKVTNVTGNQTIKAIWSPKSYTVTFDPNQGVTPSPSSKSVINGARYGLMPTTSRIGYEFNGWYTQASGGTKIEPTTIALLDSNQTIFAQWKPINYNNSFEADAVGTSYSNITDWFTQKVRTGFTVGFSWDPDGVIYQADLQVVTDRKYSGNKSLKSWVKNYETGGARYTSNLIKNIEGNRFKLNGDSFSVWVSDMSYTTSSRYAHGFWIRVLDIDNVYTELLRCISWRADEGCGGAFYNNYDQSATGADGQTWYRYTVNVPSGMNKDRLEVEFLHEASSWDGTIAESTIYIDWFDSNLELIQLSQHTITYNANGGTCSPTSRMIYDGLTALAPSCSRTGYTLSGFTRTSGSGGTLNTSTGEVTNVTGSQTIRADWTANTYTVTFDRRSGSGGSSSVTATYGLAMPSATAPTRTGYTFNGYFDATSGGTQYYTSAMASARTWNKTSNTTLYAQWTANTYTVTLNRNGGSGGSSSVTATYGSNMPGITVPTRQYFNFLGYWDATSGGTQYYSSSGTSSRTWNKTSNTTLYARWQDVCGNLTQITDSRDNKVYGIIAISGKCWTTKNAGYTEGGNNFRPAGGDDNNINTFGVLYKQWQAVNSACPSGWRMALSTDYSTLSTSDLDGSWNHKNAGYGEQYLDWTTIKHRYFDFNSYGYYWNSTRTGVSDAAYQRRCIGCAWNTGTMNNDRLLSVRCIKN